MNWIKINKDTVIPDTVPVLIKVTLGGGILKGCIIPDTNSTFEVEHRETVYQREEYSHYCLVSEPTKVNPIDSIKYHLKESEHELDKWEGREDITYNDTDYNAASVNFGKIEALKDCLRILYGRD